MGASWQPGNASTCSLAHTGKKKSTPFRPFFFPHTNSNRPKTVGTLLTICYDYQNLIAEVTIVFSTMCDKRKYPLYTKTRDHLLPTKAPTSMQQSVALTNVEVERNKYHPDEDIIRFTVVVLVAGYAFWEIPGWTLIAGKIQVPRKLERVAKGTLQTNVVFPHYAALRTIYEAIRSSDWTTKYSIGELREPAFRLAEPYSPPSGTPSAPLYIPSKNNNNK